jgi:hypothetical protein
MVVKQRGTLCFFDEELSSHAEMHKPYLLIIKVQVEIFAATAKLGNRSPSQDFREIGGKRAPESWLPNRDSTDRRSREKRRETPAHRFYFWQFRHHSSSMR